MIYSVPLHSGSWSVCAHSWFLAVGLIGLALGASQAQVLPNAYTPHRVTRLARVPEPAGGLVPYRKGHMWGYSDTTGRVVIQVGFEQEPRPFALGFGTLAENPLTLINARGEVLRASGRQAISFAPGGGLALVSRRGVGFRPALGGIRYPKGRHEAVADTLWLSPHNNGDERLSPTRGLRTKNSRLPGKFLALNPEYERAALTNEHGRRLTGYEYSNIYPFLAGFAVAARTGNAAGMVLLNRQGREVVPRSASVTQLYNNRALVSSQQERSQVDLVDSTGLVIKSLTTNGRAGWLIAGEVFVAARPSGLGFVHFYDRNGQLLLGGQQFREVGQFWNNRLWVRTMDGKEGLLDRRLQWVVPAEYQALNYRGRDESKEHYLYPGNLEYFLHDTAYMVAKQHDHYGQVVVASGRLVIPVRYDSIVSPLTQGFATVQRSGQPYVVNRQGVELSSGSANGLHATCRDGACQVGIVRGNKAALFDDTGQQLCPWQDVSPPRYKGALQSVPHYGYDGLVIVYKDPPLIDGISNDNDRLANLVTRTGQPQLPWRYESIGTRSGFYSMRLYPKSGRVTTLWELYDRQLRPLLSQPVSELSDLSGGWISTGTELFHEGGRQVAVPDAVRQRFSAPTQLLPDEPFAKGIWRVEWYEPNQRLNKYAGYITIHGRHLWED